MNNWLIVTECDYCYVDGVEDYIEWITVTNGDKSFDCGTREDAYWLCDVLNKNSPN